MSDKYLIPYDLQPPLKILVPNFSPSYRTRRPPERMKLPPAPEGQVWVYIEWQGEYGCEHIAWRQWREPAAHEYELRHLRLVPIDTLAKWERVRREDQAVEVEVERIYE